MFYYIGCFVLWMLMLLADAVCSSLSFEPRNKKSPRWKYVVCLMAAEFPFMLAKILAGNHALLRNVCGVCMFFSVLVILIWLFEGELWKKVLFRILMVAFSFLAEMITMGILKDEIAEQLGETYFGTPLMLTLSLYVFTITLLFYFLLCIVKKKIFDRKPYSMKSFLVFCVFPINQVLLMLSFNEAAYTASRVNVAEAWLGAAIGILADMLLFYTLTKQQDMLEVSRRLHAVQKAWEVEQNHYREIEARREELARIRHDMNEQLYIMSRLLKNEDYDKVHDMLGTLAVYMESTRECVYCGDSVVNAVMAENEKICEEKRIRLIYDLLIPYPLKLNPVAVCSIFSNLMRNAVAAAEKVQNSPFVEIKASLQGGYLSVATKNSYIPQKKTDRKGYGQSILRSLAEQYNGSMVVEEGDGCYRVSVIVENKNEKRVNKY